MGITVWSLRENATPRVCKRNTGVYQPNLQCVLYNTDKKPIGVLLAETDDHTPLSAQKNLLQKMADALVATKGTVDITEITEIIDTNAYFHFQFFILLNNTVSFSLSNLIQNPENKKALWMDIKRYVFM